MTRRLRPFAATLLVALGSACGPLEASVATAGYSYDAPLQVVAATHDLARVAHTTPTARTHTAARGVERASAERRWSPASSNRRGSAAKEAPAIVRGGETAATRYGREIHKTFDYGPGFRREFSLPSGRRADAVNLRTREVVELKPNNPRAIASGRRQLDAYARELEELYPGTPFTRRPETYDRP